MQRVPRIQTHPTLVSSRNEIDLRQLRDSGQLELVLVDHHTLPPEDAELAETVQEVVDHRPQDPAWPWEGRKVTLETVGSCASLVARAILERSPEAMTPQLARLLRGTPACICLYMYIYGAVPPRLNSVISTRAVSSFEQKRAETASSLLTPALYDDNKVSVSEGGNFSFPLSLALARVRWKMYISEREKKKGAEKKNVLVGRGREYFIQRGG